jgi:TRAP-type mannitol/chloroaromatic compound transport system substrate-binding protein
MRRQAVSRLVLAVALVLSVVALGAGSGAIATAQAPVVLKIQASWPASLTIFEHLKMVADRVDKLSGGTLKIEALAAGAIVPAFEVLDATHRRVIDGAHTVAYYWAGKNKTAVLFTGGPGGNFGMDFVDVLGWMYEGGGLELYQEFYRNVLKMNIVPLPAFPSGPQALGWFKRPIKDLADFKGMKCRQTGINTEIYTEMGMRTVNLPGGEILPAAERGVIDCAEWVGGIEDLRLGFPNVWKYHYTPGMHEPVTMGEIIINGEVWEKLSPQHKEIIKSATTEAFIRWYARWQRQNADALREFREKHKVNVLKTPDEILVEFLKTWDKVAEREAARDPFFKKVLESQRQYASVVVPAKRFLFPPYDFAANHYWPERRTGGAAKPPAKK